MYAAREGFSQACKVLAQYQAMAFKIIMII